MKLTRNAFFASLLAPVLARFAPKPKWAVMDMGDQLYIPPICSFHRNAFVLTWPIAGRSAPVTCMTCGHTRMVGEYYPDPGCPAPAEWQQEAHRKLPNGTGASRYYASQI